jgi:hypothetical protein
MDTRKFDQITISVFMTAFGTIKDEGQTALFKDPVRTAQ